MQHGRLSEAQLRALVAEIHAGTFSSETDWVEWKRELDFTTAEGRFPLPKNILGMANRMPDIARRNNGGYGYILIGVEHEFMPGATEVDVAQLEDWIAPFLGATGPSWQPRYLRLDNLTILAVEVEPPRPGDSIRTLRRAFDNFNAGTIFVRKNGKTERALPEDIENLIERSQGSRLELDLQLVGPEQLSWFDGESIREVVQRRISDSRDEQLERARGRERPRDLRSIFQQLEQPLKTIRYGSDPRSRLDYEQQVLEWHGFASDVAFQHWLDRYISTSHAVYALRLENLTDQNFADVEVRLRFEGVLVETAIPELAVEVPSRPAPFGSAIDPRNFVRVELDDSPFDIAEPRIFESADIAALAGDDDAIELVWSVGHLRPEATQESPEFCIVLQKPLDASHLTVNWSATSTSTRGVLKYSQDIPLAARQITIDDIEHALLR